MTVNLLIERSKILKCLFIIIIIIIINMHEYVLQELSRPRLGRHTLVKQQLKNTSSWGGEDARTKSNCTCQWDEQLMVIRWSPPRPRLIVYNLVDVDFDMFFFQSADSTSTHTHTRGHCRKLCKPLCNSVFIAGTYRHRVINVWNALPDTVVTAPSATSFKKH